MAEINKNDIISQEALDVVDQMRKRVKALQEALILAMGAGRQLNDGLGGQEKISEMAAEIRKLNANIVSLSISSANLEQAKKELAASTIKLENSTKSETAAKKTNNKTTSDSTSEEKKATAAKKEAARQSNKKAQADLNAAKTMRAEAATIRANTALTRAEAAAKKAAEAASKANNKTNKEATNINATLGGSLKKLISAAGQLAGAYFTIQGAISIFKKFRDITKDLDSLNFSMKATISNTFELAQTQFYLLDISKRYGLDIVEITNSYIKFRAAVNESNMTIGQGQKIFASMAKASAVLGMTMDKTNDVFLALEQMVGKGSVMSEELRRQMGQHLPVAVTAMAMAAQRAGVSISGSVAELMDLMKAGKVVAAEVLPYFGEEVEKQLGITAKNAVDTLATAQANLTLAWIEFVKAMDKAPILTTVYKNIGKSVQWAADLIKSETQKIQEGAGSIASDINDKLVEGTTEKEKQIILDAEINRLLERRKELEEGESDIIKNSPKPSVGYIMARQTWQTMGGDPSRFDATFQKPNRALAEYINEEEAITRTLQLIKDNYAELIKVKVNKNNLSDEEDEKAKRKADERLKIFKDNQAEELANYIQYQQEMRAQAYINITESGSTDIDRERAEAQLKMDMETSVSNFKQKQNKTLQEFITKNIADNLAEIADAKKAEAQNERDLATKTTEHRIDEINREFKAWREREAERVAQEKREIEDKKDADIAKIETGVTGEILNLAEGLPKGPIKDQRAYGQVENKYSIDVLKVQERGLLDLLNVKNLTINEEADMMKKLDDVRKALAMAEREDIQKTYDLRKELTAEAFKFSSEAMNETFNLFSGLQDAQIQKLEWQHEREVNLAGENVAKKIAAENKYDTAKRKLQRRQAVLQKAQSVSNIIINTVEAIMATLGETGFLGLPLTPIIAGIGAISLATALAQPIPSYEAGGIHTGGPARFSEKGPELFIPDANGKPLLTPKNETVANMPAGKFIPTDETSRILASNAMNNFMYTDMSPTNNLLKTIASKSDIKYIDGYKITNTGRYATRS